MEHRTPYSADEARREIADALDRADDLGQAIATQLAEAERELEEIKRSDVVTSAWQARPIRS